MSQDPWPTEIRLLDEGARLRVTFEGGETFDLPAEFLRVVSPSAEVRGHGPDQAQTIPGKKHVRVGRIEPVGAYAVRLVFDDGHDSGLYTWGYLHHIGVEQERLWRDYLSDLTSKGLSREA